MSRGVILRDRENPVEKPTKVPIKKPCSQPRPHRLTSATSQLLALQIHGCDDARGASAQVWAHFAG